MDAARILSRYDGRILVPSIPDAAVLRFDEHVIVARRSQDGCSLVVEDDGHPARFVFHPATQAWVLDAGEAVDGPKVKLEEFIGDVICRKIPG